MEEDSTQALVRHLREKIRNLPFDSLDLHDNQPYINYADEKLEKAECYEYEIPYITSELSEFNTFELTPLITNCFQRLAIRKQ